MELTPRLMYPSIMFIYNLGLHSYNMEYGTSVDTKLNRTYLLMMDYNQSRSGSSTDLGIDIVHVDGVL